MNQIAGNAPGHIIYGINDNEVETQLRAMCRELAVCLCLCRIFIYTLTFQENGQYNYDTNPYRVTTQFHLLSAVRVPTPEELAKLDL